MTAGCDEHTLPLNYSHSVGSTLVNFAANRTKMSKWDESGKRGEEVKKKGTEF